MDFVKILLDTVEIADVLSHYGIASTGTRFSHACGTGAPSSENYATIYHGQNTFYCHRCGRYGTAVELLMDHEGVSRAEAITSLGDTFEIPVEGEDLVDVHHITVQNCLTAVAMKYHANLMASAETLAWVEETWGITAELVQQFKLGLGAPIPPDDLPFPNRVLLDGGIISPQGVCVMDRRLVIPTFRQGRVVWMTGRALPGNEERKYMNLFKTEYVRPTLFNYDIAYRGSNPTVLGGARDILVCEGPLDAIAAAGAGYLSVSVGGKESASLDILNDLVIVANRARTTYLTFDNDRNGSGIAGAHKMAESMIRLGYDPVIVELPRQEDQVKVDMATFLLEYGHDSLVRVLDEARSFEFDSRFSLPVTVLTLHINALSSASGSVALDKVVNLLASLPESLWPLYIPFLAARTGLKPSAVNKLVNKARRVIGNTQATMRFADTDDVCLTFYSQDYRFRNGKWEAIKLIHCPMLEQATLEDGTVSEQTVMVPYLIQTEMDNAGWRITKNQQIYKEDMSYEDQRRVPAYMPERMLRNNWSVRRDQPQSVPNFLRREAVVDPVETYNEMVRLAKRYIFLPEEMDYHIVVTYCFLSYIYMGMPSIPYLHFYGEKNTGKSTLKEYMHHLCFQALDMVNPNPAQIFREAHARRPTIMIDEAENYNFHNKNPGVLEMIALLNVGYRASAAQVARVNTNSKTFENEYFDAYCPKIFQSIRPIMATTSSRCITIHTQRYNNNGHLRAWEADEPFLIETMQNLRNQLFVWSMTEFHNYYTCYQQVRTELATEFADPRVGKVLVARNAQIWSPVVAFLRYLTERGADSSLLDDLYEYIPSRLAREERGMVTDIRAAVFEGFLDVYGEALSDLRQNEHLLPNLRVFPLTEKGETLWDADRVYVDLGEMARQIQQTLRDRNAWRSTWELSREDLRNMLNRIAPVPNNTIRRRFHGGTYRVNELPHKAILADLASNIIIIEDIPHDTSDATLTAVHS